MGETVSFNKRHDCIATFNKPHECITKKGEYKL